MKKLLLSLLALCAVTLTSGTVSARENMRHIDGGTVYRCGHCQSHIEHEHAKCHTHGCPGATVICEKPVTVVKEETRKCETKCDYECPENTEPRGHGANMKCIKNKVVEECVPAIKRTTVDCRQACPAGTTMKPGSERDSALPREHIEREHREHKKEARKNNAVRKGYNKRGQEVREVDVEPEWAAPAA